MAAVKIAITGGAGFVGRALTGYFVKKGYTVTVFDRVINKGQKSNNRLKSVYANLEQPGEWQKLVVQHDIIINLAGEPIFTRWTNKKKQKLINSRVLTTNNIVEAVKLDNSQVSVLINASAVGYYGNTLDELVTEESPAGNGFLSDLCSGWEKKVHDLKGQEVRYVIGRFGLILSLKGGLLKRLYPFFRYFLGAKIGPGQQWMSWIHIKDFQKIIQYLIDNESISGAVNITSPFPVRNFEFTQSIAYFCKRPVILPRIPKVIFKFLWGDASCLLLDGQKVIPDRLLLNGFRFEFPHINDALFNIIRYRE